MPNPNKLSRRAVLASAAAVVAAPAAAMLPAEENHKGLWLSDLVVPFPGAMQYQPRVFEIGDWLQLVVQDLFGLEYVTHIKILDVDGSLLTLSEQIPAGTKEIRQASLDGEWMDKGYRVEAPSA